MREATTKEAIRIEARKTRDEIRFWGGICLLLLLYIAYFIKKDVIMLMFGCAWFILFVFQTVGFWKRAKNNDW